MIQIKSIYFRCIYVFLCAFEEIFKRFKYCFIYLNSNIIFQVILLDILSRICSRAAGKGKVEMHCNHGKSCSMNKAGVLLVSVIFIVLLVFSGSASAKKNSLNITITERISQISAYDGSSKKNTGTSLTGVALNTIKFNGTIIIKNVGLDILSNVNVTFNRTANITSNFTVVYAPAYVNFRYSSIIHGVDAWVYLRQLNVGDNVTLRYTAYPSNFGDPINVTESYSENRIMVGSSINVTLNVTNSIKRNVNLYNVVLT